MSDYDKLFRVPSKYSMPPGMWLTRQTLSLQSDVPSPPLLQSQYTSPILVGAEFILPVGAGEAGASIIEPEPLPLAQLLGKRDYCGGHIYLNDTIERVLTPVGYYNDLGDHFAYVKDWQGNVRVTAHRHGARFCCSL